MTDLRFYLTTHTSKNGLETGFKIDDSYLYHINIQTENNQLEQNLLDVVENSVLPEEIIIDETINGISTKSSILKTYRIAYLPKNFAVCVKRFSINENWEPIKMNIDLLMPDDDIDSELDFSKIIADKVMLKSYMISENTPTPKNDSNNSTEETLTDTQEVMISQLQSMGFSNRKANIAAVIKFNDVEMSIPWLIDNQDKYSANNPTSSSLDSKLKPLDYANVKISEENITFLMEMGFSKILASDALRFKDNSLENAIELLMSNPEGDFQANEMTKSFTEKNNNNHLQHKNQLTFENLENNSKNSNKCRLKAFIIHTGKTVHNGHYIAYIRLKSDGEKEGWYEFNDEKVHRVQYPPYKQAYLYFFERVDAD